MTRAKATEKAARLTAAGTPTMVQKNASRPGGWRTASVAPTRAARARYYKSKKGRAARARYEVKPEAQARYVRHRQTAKWRATQVRSGTKRETGTRLHISGEDIIALRQKQNGRCPITGLPLSEIPTTVDHAHGDEHNGAEAVRGIIHRNWNSVLGRTDSELFDYAANLMSYAVSRRGVLAHRACRVYRPTRRRVSKRKMKAAATRIVATTNDGAKEGARA